jgi:CHASE2 domain-containing sensor protein
VNLKTATERKLSRPALGAGLAVVCGLALLGTRLGQGWVNTSYDYLFWFGARGITNQVVLVEMDNESYAKLHQERGKPWDRALHAEMLNKLADGGCRLAVLDTFLETTNDPAKDTALAKAIGRLRGVALMAWQEVKGHAELDAATPKPPVEIFLAKAGTNNWGVAGVAQTNRVVRRHWPFPAPGPYPSLAWTASRLAGANLSTEPQQQWLRYYGPNGVRSRLSYVRALKQDTNFFHDKVVFIGGSPQSKEASLPEEDKFSTPYTHWNDGQAVGGVEIMATEFLNLVNEDWLRRPPWWVEIGLLSLSGVVLGGGLCRVRWPLACGLAAGAALAVMLAAVSLSYATNYWFPWLVIAGGQVPCALLWALAGPRVGVGRADGQPTVRVGQSQLPAPGVLVTPEYRRFEPPIGKGAFGEVWLAETVIKERKALKVVYRAECERNEVPYEVEFEGITKYKPISNKHPGLLHLDHVGRNDLAGYFYYVMELGDALAPDWDGTAASYKPSDLNNILEQAGGRLPVRDCVQIGLALAEALDFLHQQGLVHRDIKPRNIIFVQGKPKLADIGLVTGIRTASQIRTFAGSLPYMPPPPEPSGTKQADIYSLGKVLYVLSTGLHPLDDFPKLPPAVMDTAVRTDFMRLDEVIVMACRVDPVERYPSAAQMRAALWDVKNALATADRLNK